MGKVWPALEIMGVPADDKFKGTMSREKILTFEGSSC
jgi:hypothetical protein